MRNKKSNIKHLNAIIDDIYNDSIKLFELYNINRTETTKIRNQLNNLFNNISDGINNIVDVNKLDLINKVRQIRKSFEELTYDIDVLITNILYSSDNPFSNSTSGGFLYEVEYMDKSKINNVDKEVNKILEDNDIEIQLRDLLNNIISYGYTYIYFYNGYSRIMVLSPEDITIIKKENTNKNKQNKRGPYKINDKFSESRLFTNIIYTVDDINDWDIYINNSDIKIDPNYLYILSNKPGKIYGESLLNKALKYLIIISMLEIIQTLERISKSKMIHLILFDISDIEPELVMKYSSLYSNVLKNRLAVDVNESGEFSFDYIKGLVDNYAILPVEGKDKIRVESLKGDFKPVNQDLNYQQKKVYLSLGIPPWMHIDMNDQATTMPTEYYNLSIDFFKKKIKYYRGIVSKLVSLQIRQYLYFKYNKDVNINVKIIDYSEYKVDVDYLNKFIDAVFKLVNTGMMVKEEWLIKTIFPNSNVDDIVIRGIEDVSINDENVESINKLLSSSLDKNINKSYSTNKEKYIFIF